MVASVSLAVPVFNGEQFLEGALSAILDQTFEDFEVVITDNASTDKTSDICTSFFASDRRIRYVRLPENIGAGPNFNHAFSLCTGKYFKWCAHDDLISPNFLERCVETLDNRPDVALAFGRTECIDSTGAAIDWAEEHHMPPIEDDDPAKRLGRAIRESGTCFPIFGLFRSDALRKTTLHRPYYGSDRALLAEVALLGKLALVEDAVFYNRHHERRSIEIEDHGARAQWHTATSSRWKSPESISFVRHLTEIALRHGDAAKRLPALAQVARYGLAPRRLAQYALGVARMVSPKTADRLKGVWAGMFGRSGSSPEIASRQNMKSSKLGE